MSQLACIEKSELKECWKAHHRAKGGLELTI